ncbi:MAG: hypothetical protein FWF79_04800 [Defluviitaleaceae bacterium]|nr:hypothetical protein [Defluviitaleaceae bacterium]
MNNENSWQVFAISGDPLAYLEYTRLRNEWRDTKDRRNSSAKTQRI